MRLRSALVSILGVKSSRLLANRGEERGGNISPRFD
jgi:hypothetical protein